MYAHLCTHTHTRLLQLGAFCVDPVFRGSGRGDSLLDYVEQVRRQSSLTHASVPPKCASSTGIMLISKITTYTPSLQDARANGIQRLVLLTTRTADWFEQRDFQLCGECSQTAAHVRKRGCSSILNNLSIIAATQRLSLSTAQKASLVCSHAHYYPCSCITGSAAYSPLLPAKRREKINPVRNSQLYAKTLEAPDDGSKLPGKRIGF